MSMDICCSSET